MTRCRGGNADVNCTRGDGFFHGARIHIANVNFNARTQWCYLLDDLRQDGRGYRGEASDFHSAGVVCRESQHRRPRALEVLDQSFGLLEDEFADSREICPAIASKQRRAKVFLKLL